MNGLQMVFDQRRVTRVKATLPDPNNEQEVDLVYNNCKVIGSGSFGVVFKAQLIDSGEEVAIKKVLQDRRFKVASPNAHSAPPVLRRVSLSIWKFTCLLDTA
jgi:glycogen synthase kinase 3 beta